ncbi:MAG: urea ABC transporter permease subunit UrtB, partial [Rhodoferax sp.]|nr:urea ABC transporter permease subunit UrtB [Rhodoferax sp.]
MRHYLAIAALLFAAQVHALTADQVKGITVGETDSRVEALAKAMLSADDKTAAFLQALSDDAVKVAGDKILVIQGDRVVDAVTAAEVAFPADAEDVINNNRMRGELDSALAALKLFSKD